MCVCVCVCVSPEESAPGAPESEEDVIQIHSALCEDILPLFPTGHCQKHHHQVLVLLLKLPLVVDLSLSLPLIARLSVFSRARLKSGEEAYSRERKRLKLI